MTPRRDSASAGRLVMVGVSHHTAPVEVRERLALDALAWSAAAGERLPSVLLTTCNRVEVYGWATGRPARTAGQIVAALSRASGCRTDEIEPHLATRVGLDALVHLVRVGAGLDSLVIGEDQIQGQLRVAYREAARAGRPPSPLEGIFHRALEGARRIRAAVHLGSHPSVASAAVHAAGHMPPLAGAGPRGQLAVVLGAGAVAKATARALVVDGARVVICNRTAAHAEKLAHDLGPVASAAGFEDLPELLGTAGVVFGATASRVPVLTTALLEPAIASRDGRPLLVFDLAVPRDVEPDARSLTGLTLLDLDDLERLCPVDTVSRRAAIDEAEALARREAEQIARWLRVRAMSATIVDVRQRAEEVRHRELKRAAGELRGLTVEQAAAVDRLTESIVRKLIHGPTVALREAAARPRAARSQRRVLDVLRLDQMRDWRESHGRGA